MKRTALVCLAITWATFACAHGPQGKGLDDWYPPAMDVEEPDPIDPITEAEVRAFLDAEMEDRQADDQADEAVTEHKTESRATDALFDPADFDIPIHYNERVQFWIDHFQTKQHGRFALYLERMGRYEEMIRSELRARGMPEDLIYLALIESGFSPVARSHANAVGVWQFIAGTGRLYGLEISRYVDERRDPVKATGAALDYLQKLYNQFGSWYLAAAAYNTGEGRIERILRRYADGARGADSLYWQISSHLHSETRNYVPKLVAAAILGKYREKFGFGDVTPEPPMTFDVVTVPDATDLSVIAEAAGVKTAEIEALNPQFLRGITPPGKKVDVRIPVGRAEAFNVAYAEIPPSRRIRVVEHVIRRGETLSHIARRYGTTVAALQELNRIKNPSSITAGRRLIVALNGKGGTQGSAAVAQAAAPNRAPVAKTTAATSTTSTKASPTPTTTYRVRAGDSLWSIAQRHGVSVEDLRVWNNLGSKSKIIPGQELKVRGSGQVIVYKIQEGDTIWGIARKHGVSAARIKEWNNLSDDAIIRPGDQVEVPINL